MDIRRRSIEKPLALCLRHELLTCCSFINHHPARVHGEVVQLWLPCNGNATTYAYIIVQLCAWKW